jgi:hypothetical protein
MLARTVTFLFCVVVFSSSSAASRERQLIGTWREQGIDYAAYLIFRADHSYARVVEARHPDFPQNTLICSGTWHIEGTDLVKDCIAAYPPRSDGTRRAPERHVERMPLTTFFKALHKHSAISYIMP